MSYDEFLNSKTHLGGEFGFDPVFMPDALFDFQKTLVDWAVRKGRGAIFADCGLGKTLIQLVWAENVVRKTNKRVLIIAPLAVGPQTIREGELFGVGCSRSKNGSPSGKITITNYEQLHHFSPNDYIGAVCDESSILKNFNGTRRALITEFVRTLPYRLLCTATAAPNDYIELGTSSEALGVMGHMDMLGRFFKNTQNTMDTKTKWRMHGGAAPAWRFKKHAEQLFWRWVCSWARAVRKPSDIGGDDNGFILPGLTEKETVVETEKCLPGELFPRPAISLHEQRHEQRMTIDERCEMVAKMCNGQKDPMITWCHLNDEGNELARMIPGSVQVAGSDSDEKKEERLLAFSRGEFQTLVTKPKIASFGLNWQHCSRMTFFPSHSYEQYYQSVRRCWRFGQTRPVTVNVITTQGGVGVLNNLKKKATAADKMFSSLVSHMNDPLLLENGNPFTEKEEVPSWL